MLPDPLPGTSYGETSQYWPGISNESVAENPVEVDSFSNAESDSSVCPQVLRRPGDSIGKLRPHDDQNNRPDYKADNPIDLDTTYK